MYVRNTNDVEVTWNPENSEYAAEAISAVSGTGVDTVEQAKTQDPVDLTGKTDVQDQVRQYYSKKIEMNLSVGFEDGVVDGEGVGSETATVEIKDGFGDLVDGAFMVNVDIDGAIKEADVTGGSGTVSITTAKSPGGTVAVQAVSVDGVDPARVSQSKNKALDVE